VFVPLMAPVVFLMGVGPLARWKQAELGYLARRLRWAALAAVAAALVAAWAGGTWSAMSVLGFLMALWVLAALAADLGQRLAPAGEGFAGIVRRARQLPRAMLGMMLAHLGVGVFAFGVTMVNNHQIERDVTMRAGDTATLGDYTFTFIGVQPVRGPNYQATRAHIEVARDGRKLGDMRPEKRVYSVQRMPMTEAAIRSGVTGDLYVSLGDAVGDAWVVRLHRKPFITWIWGGCLLMAMGGVLAITDRRYRSLARREAPLPAQAADADAGPAEGARA
jgi:cytochrome c-type biogenesis protein CcmF